MKLMGGNMTLIRLMQLFPLLEKEKQPSKAGHRQVGIIHVRQCLRQVAWTLAVWSREGTEL